jgi:glutathione synthase/RimK-type ligase-like ATP-grasp enzyme
MWPAMTVAIMSTTKLPRFLGDDHPDQQTLFAEDDALIAALKRQNIAARRIPWREPEADWAQFDAIIIRSIWDYIDHVDEFRHTLGRIDRAGVRLINPLGTIAWNIDKRYLRELARLGVPIVPTWFVEAADADFPADLPAAPGGYVVKPVIGVGAFLTERCRDLAAVRTAIVRAAPKAPLMIQPFLTAVVQEGEWSFVFAGGAFLYAVLKRPNPGDYRTQVMYGASTRQRQPDKSDLAAARRCFEALPVDADIARLDFVRLATGGLALMEAELIEPQLYLFDVPDAAGLLASALARVLANS